MVSDSLNNQSTDKRLRPRLNLQWIVLVLALISIPWLGYRFVAETRVFLVEGQMLAQEQLAQGVVTLFQGRSDLLAELPYLDSQQVVFSHTLVKPANVDGYTGEWLDFQLLAHHFDTGDMAEDGYSLLLGEYGDYIYGLVKVKDNLTVLRQPDHPRLDTSDHLRLSLPDRYGNERRLLLVAEQPGIMQAWYVKEDWATRKYNHPSSTFIIQAVMRPIVDGYLVEFALPNYFLNERQEFGLAVVDVDDDLVQHLKTLVNPTQTTIESHYNLLAMSSPEANRMLEKLDRANSQIVVYDSQLLIRASVGQLVSQSTDASQLLSPLEWLQNLGNKVLRQLGQWFDYFAPVVDINQEQILLQQGKDKAYARGRWHTPEGQEIIANGIGWGEMKQELFEYLDTYLSPARQRFGYIIQDPEYIETQLQQGAVKARQYSQPFMAQLCAAVGITALDKTLVTSKEKVVIKQAKSGDEQSSILVGRQKAVAIARQREAEQMAQVQAEIDQLLAAIKIDSDPQTAYAAQVQKLQQALGQAANKQRKLLRKKLQLLQSVVL